MTVLCAIPVQIPVHRIRVRVQCLATGGPVHTAALRLADYWGEAPEEIGEVLGLPIPRVEQLLTDLANGGEPIERDFVLWVDHAREHVLHYTALTGAAVKPEKDGPLTLPADPPTPAMLANMGLDAPLSWDLGLGGHAEVLDIEDVHADIRDRTLPHVLRLPDTQLLITTNDPASTAFDFSVAQHATIDSQLTAWARANHADTLQALVETADLGATEKTIRELADIAAHGKWQPIDPHPARLREQITQAAENAERRLAIAAPDLSHIPAWLSEILTDAADRDVQVVLCPTQAELVPKRADFSFMAGAAPNQTGALALLADETHAVLYSDPPACLDRPAKPARQHLHATRDREAIAWLRESLALKPLAPSAPRRPLTQTTIAAMLRQALDDLRSELPAGVDAAIQPEDERFAIETLERHPGREQPTQAARKAAAGIAWERVVMTRMRALAAEPNRLQIRAERLRPHGARIDLDLIVTDNTKNLTWIIDAKNADPNADQLAKMQTQLRLVRADPALHRKRRVIGVIVHRRAQLDPPIQPTEYQAIMRATLQALPGLLLAGRLPGEQQSQAAGGAERISPDAPRSGSRPG